MKRGHPDMCDGRIRVSLGRTYNCGNYESARVDVAFERDIAADEMPEQAFEAIRSFVMDKVNGDLASELL